MSPLDVDRDVSNAYCLQRMHVENRAPNQPRSKGLSSPHPKGSEGRTLWGGETKEPGIRKNISALDV